MMNANELMRGDYVMFVNQHKIIRYAKVDQVLKYSCVLLYDVKTGEHNFEDEIIVNYEDIKPIKINDEFLKEHGFDVAIDHAKLEYQFNGLRRYFYLMKEYNKDDKEYVDNYCVGEDNYTDKLHIIQHAMRLDLVPEFELFPINKKEIEVNEK